MVTSTTTASRLSQVSFSGSAIWATVTISGLSNQSIYLVKVNNSDSEAAASQTGNALETPSRDADAVTDEATVVDPSASPVSGQFGPIRRYDFAGARKFNANPPAISRSAARGATSAAPGSDKYKADDVGTAKWTGINVVTNDNEPSNYKWTTIDATLQAVGTYANIWVADSYFSTSNSSSDGKITRDQAKKIAGIFDKIYPVETNVIGHEYGYGTTGGRDNDNRVNILIYDIAFDLADDPVAKGGIVGYFWGKDYYTDPELASIGYTGYKTNYSEIFYIDSQFADEAPGIMYSTLCHEFQHMVNFNNKFVKTGSVSDIWYDEMLSMTVEDMMSSYLEDWLGSDYSALSDGPILNRMTFFDGGFFVSGVTDWLSLYYDGKYTTMFSYASAYAFGAYLARNYGGAPLIAAMEANSSVNMDSVSAALASVGASATTFSAAFQRYGEALVFSSSAYSDKTVPSSFNTFDRASTTTVGSYSYTFPAFDIWNLSYTDSDGITWRVSPASQIGNETIITYYGVGFGKQIDLRPYGMSLHSRSSWQNVTGSLTVTLSKPTDSDVSLYLMVR